MKAVERRQQETVLHTWKTLLEKLNRIGPTSESHDDLEAYGNVKDYILDRIEECESRLTESPARHYRSRSRKSVFLRHSVNGLPPLDNAADNRPTSGEENA